MNRDQRKMFIVSNAGMWSWLQPDGVWVARSCHESRSRWLEHTKFVVTHYPWQDGKYRQARRVVEQRMNSDMESDVRLLQIVDEPFERLAALIDVPVAEGPLPDNVAYRKSSNVMSWHVPVEQGLAVVLLRRQHRTSNGYLTISLKPWDVRKRWHPLYRSDHTKPGGYEWPEALREFSFMATNLDSFLMESML